MDPEQTRSLALVLAPILAVAAVVIYYGMKRIVAVRTQMMELAEDHDRYYVHAQYRLSAQKEQALAERAEGEERVEHLKRSHELWRKAIQTRDPQDEATYQHLRSILAELEADLRAAGAPVEDA